MFIHLEITLARLSLDVIRLEFYDGRRKPFHPEYACDSNMAELDLLGSKESSGLGLNCLVTLKGLKKVTL